MATLPAVTFYWRNVGGAADAWTEDSDGTFTPTAGQQVEVVSVGPSPISRITADTTPTVTVADLSASYGASVTINPTYGGTNRAYALSGPDWLSINASTGQITGTAPDEDVSTTATVTVRNAAGSASDTFSVTVAEVSLTEVTLPGGFGWTPPMSVFIDGDGVYSTDFDKADYIAAPAATYYISPIGNDSNDGLSVGAPKKSLGALVTAINAAPPGAVTIFAAAGLYHGHSSDTLAGGSFGFDVNLIGVGGRAIFAEDYAAVWTESGTRPGVYTAPRGSASSWFLDATQLSAINSRPIRLEQSADVDEVEATAGSWLRGSTSVAVRTFDTREPTGEDGLILRADRGGWAQTSARNIYMENISFWGGNKPAIITASTGQYVFVNCEFSYGLGVNVNGFEVEASATSGLIAIQSAGIAGYNSYDGFNYNGGRIAEIGGCSAVGNGTGSSNANDNGTTSHLDTLILRVNTIARLNGDRNVHDVGTGKSLNYGVVAGGTLNGSATPYESFNFGAGVSGGSDTLTMWLFGCESLGSAAADVLAAAETDIQIDATSTGMDVQTELDTGSITVAS